MKKAVIFDLDGTLADTLESIARCTNRAMGDFGLPPLETERFRRFVGDGARTQVTRALRAAGDPEGGALSEPDDDGYLTRPVHLEPVLQRYMEYFKTGCTYRVRPYDGMEALLALLRERGVRTAVLTNKPHPNAVDVVESVFGAGSVDVIQGQEPSFQKKPSPEGVYRVLEKLNVKADEALYVGDSCVDMDTGKNAALQTIGVLWGFRDAEELTAHGADALIGRPDELLLYIE